MFLHQDPKSPHLAGHYGHIVFKPYSLLQVLDQGVESYTGTTIRLEAHRQNDAVFSPASTQSSLIRLGEFSFAVLLQVVIPLLIIFIGYRAVITDRRNGTLKILVSQGVSMRKLIFSKIFAYHVFFTLVLVLMVILLSVFVSLQIGTSVLSMITGRLLLLVFVYSVYYWIIIALTVFFSGTAKSSAGLLTGLLAVWFVWTIIMPKLTASLGAVSYPLITKARFHQELSDLKKNELSGHNRKNEKTKAFIDSVRQAHHVDSTGQLPFKIGGLLMQADEKVRNKIHDKVFGHIEDTIRLQNKVSSFSGIMNPFMAVKKLSMALTATDVYHHFHFTREAEQYRRTLIAKFNEEDMQRKSQFKNDRGMVSDDFWRQIRDFTYHPASLAWSLKNVMIEVVLLLCWWLATGAIVYIRSRHITIV